MQQILQNIASDFGIHCRKQVFFYNGFPDFQSTWVYEK